MKYLFTAAEYVAWLLSCVGLPYWYATCYYRCTNGLLDRKKKQYPAHYTSGRMSRYRSDIAKGLMCGDCVGGAIKGAVWTLLGRQSNKYASGGCPDKSADGMFAWCKSQGMDWGVISTMPDLPGLAVRLSGHVGVYLGDGKVFEWRGFRYGAVITKLGKRPWTHWYELPWVDYGITETQPETPQPVKTTLGSRLIKNYIVGDDVRALQTILVELGYNIGNDGVDGKYGSDTEKAVRAFQKDNRLKVDGEYGEKSHAALMSIIAEREAAEAEDDEPEAESTKTITVTGGSVYVRGGPSTAYDVITVVHKGDALPWLATTENGWHSTVVNGIAAWITGKYTEVK